jgi:phytoene/squalene synthetase
MAGIPAVELDHCTELAMPPGSLFEFTSRFIPTGQREPLLALYALRQAIGTIAQSPVDDAVKWAKLKWWSEELIADPALSSRHPVLRALWLTGARTHLENTLLLRMISDAVLQIDVAPVSDEDALFERLAAMATTEILLELALGGAEIDSWNLEFLAAASSMFRLISSFAANDRSEAGQLPLYLLAKFTVSATQLEQKSHRSGFTQVISQLTGTGLEWFSKGLSGLKICSTTGPKPGVCAHLQLRWAMEKRYLTAIARDTNGFLVTGKRYGPADAWFAWRFLRHLK